MCGCYMGGNKLQCFSWLFYLGLASFKECGLLSGFCFDWVSCSSLNFRFCSCCNLSKLNWIFFLLDSVCLSWNLVTELDALPKNPFFSYTYIIIMEKKKTTNLFISNSLQHMLFPVPPKLTLQSIHIMLSAFQYDSSLTLDKYKNIAKKSCGQEMEGLWMIAKTEAQIVQPKLLAVLLFLQLVNSKLDASSSGFNEGIGSSFQSNFSPMSSPRSRANRSLFFTSQQNNLFMFIKRNLKIFLKLVSNDPTSEMVNITQADFNILGVLFKLDKGRSLAQFTNIFGSSPKMPLPALYEHLISRLASSQAKTQTIQNLRDVASIKDESFAWQDVRIINCQTSQIYIETVVNSLHILNCSNCTIFTAISSKIVYIDNCEKMNICVACPLLRICNSIDSTICCYSTCPPILTGDCRGLELSPHNAALPRLKQLIQESGLQVSESGINNFRMPLCMPFNEGVYTLVEPQLFSVMVLPIREESNLDGLLLTPKEYLHELAKRRMIYEEVGREIIGSGLSVEQLKVLNMHIQGRFKQWLMQSGKDKSISDLVKLIS